MSSSLAMRTATETAAPTIDGADQSIHASLGSLAAWWRGLGDLPPAWDPEHVHALRPWIGNLLIVRYDGPDETRARIALYGTTLSAVLGRDLTGLSLADASGPQDARSLLDGYRLARTMSRPHWCRISGWSGEKRMLAYERLLLPFRNGDEQRILGAMTLTKLPPEWVRDAYDLRAEDGRLLA